MNKIDIINKIRVAMVDCEDICPSIDKGDQAVIQSILHEIKIIDESNRSYRNIEELNQYHIQGAGTVVAKYIWALKSQAARAGLLHHLIGKRSYHCARVKNCNELVWKLFLDYLISDACLDSGILNDYDQAFATLKPREYATELVEVAKNPCLFNSMPKTMCMLASWQQPDFIDVLLDYFANPQRIEEYLSQYTLDEDMVKKEVNWWQHSGQYTTIIGLKYYSSEQIAAMLTQYARDVERKMNTEIHNCPDRYAKADIRYRYLSILKTLRDSISYIEKKMLT